MHAPQQTTLEQLKSDKGSLDTYDQVNYELAVNYLQTLPDIRTVRANMEFQTLNLGTDPENSVRVLDLPARYASAEDPVVISAMSTEGADSDYLRLLMLGVHELHDHERRVIGLPGNTHRDPSYKIDTADKEYFRNGYYNALGLKYLTALRGIGAKTFDLIGIREGGFRAVSIETVAKLEDSQGFGTLLLVDPPNDQPRDNIDLYDSLRSSEFDDEKETLLQNLGITALSQAYPEYAEKSWIRKYWAGARADTRFYAEMNTGTTKEILSALSKGGLARELDACGDVKTLIVRGKDSTVSPGLQSTLAMAADNYKDITICEAEGNNEIYLDIPSILYAHMYLLNQ